jgi:hypothetical protein
MRIVSESAEAERQRLEALRATLLAAVDARINELLARVASAESSKIAALERELERLDAALELTRREHAATREALESRADVDTAALSAALTASLDGIDALLATLPHGPVEPSLLRLELDEGALLSAIRTAGIVLAPRGVGAADVILRGFPTSLRPGLTLQFELALSDNYPCRAPAELRAAAALLAFHARVDVSLGADDTDSQALQAFLVPSSCIDGVVSVTVAIPESAGRSNVTVSRALVIGQPVTQGRVLPVRLHVGTGMHAPLLLKSAAVLRGAMCTPVITADGTLYAPRDERSTVQVFAADGRAMPPLTLAGLGLSSSTRSAAFNDESGTLLLADCNAGHSKLVAINAAKNGVQWSAALEGSCLGITVFPAQGVIIVSLCHLHKLHVHLLSNGSLVGSADAINCSSIAADRASGYLYVSTGATGSYAVSAFRLDGAVLSSALVVEGVVQAAGTGTRSRPLAVMPNHCGQPASFLVVGTCGEPTLRVLSLPGRHLVHTHALGGMQVACLAADPSGTALAVYDVASRSVHVLQWPLPGMPL